MSGESNLERLLACMQPVLDPETYIFATTTDTALVRRANPRMLLQESEGVTLIVTLQEAQALELQGLELQSTFPCRMITLNVHSSLAAVGFIARIASHLTQYGIGTNIVAGFYHDHIFVAEDKAEQALSALTQLAAESAKPTRS